MGKKKTGKSEKQIVRMIDDAAEEYLESNSRDFQAKRQQLIRQVDLLELEAAERLLAARICAARLLKPTKAKYLRALTKKKKERLEYQIFVFNHDMCVELISGQDYIDDVTLATICKWLAQRRMQHAWHNQLDRALLKVLKKQTAIEPLTDSAREAVVSLIGVWQDCSWSDMAWIRQAKIVIGLPPSASINPGESWSDAAIQYLNGLDDEQRKAWDALLHHAQGATSSSPSARWLKTAAPLLEPIGQTSLVDQFALWIPLVDKPRTAPDTDRPAWMGDQTNLISQPHMDLLRGLCWIAGTINDDRLPRLLGQLAMSCYKKIPQIGPRAVKVGNAVVYALGQMSSEDAVGQLAMLRVKVKFIPAQKGIEKALNAAADRLGVPRDEIEELGIPVYGLTEVGRRIDQFGDFKAELVVTSTNSTEIRWIKPDGKLQKSVPVAVKSDHADDLKELRAVAKDIQKMLPAQRDRIDGMYLLKKSWQFSVWRERYLDHPLIGVIARRLIWTIEIGKESVSVTWLDDDGGLLVDAEGKPVSIESKGATVTLWHPIGRPQAEVLLWRMFFEEREIRQPFKQAHREVYLLTDAERNTDTYSNRFAAHVLRQHQFNALARGRGWLNKLRLAVDDEYPPATRNLELWDMRAEYWIEGAGDEFGVDTTEMGVYIHVITDQVRFYDFNATRRTAHAGGGGYRTHVLETDDAPMRIEDVPALIFSEIMRDVDLFVGVASVGNNPNWLDGGSEGAYTDYWHQYSFGELSATAETRKDLLTRLVPKLAIANQCQLDGKFLIVRGSKRTYKIHLGSSNILMEPNDEYLCIVPTGTQTKAGDKISLPFEGDRTFAVILSKAFMLANDEKITDKTILSQIKR